MTLPMHVAGSVGYLAVYEDQVVMLNSDKGVVSFVRYSKLKHFGSIGGTSGLWERALTGLGWLPVAICCPWLD